MPVKLWGATLVNMGWAYLCYDWVYTPLCTKLWGIEPWSATVVGTALIGMGIMLNLFQRSIGETS